VSETLIAEGAPNVSGRTLVIATKGGHDHAGTPQKPLGNDDGRPEAAPPKGCEGSLRRLRLKHTAPSSTAPTGGDAGDSIGRLAELKKRGQDRTSGSNVSGSPSCARHSRSFDRCRLQKQVQRGRPQIRVADRPCEQEQLGSCRWEAPVKESDKKPARGPAARRHGETPAPDRAGLVCWQVPAESDHSGHWFVRARRGERRTSPAARIELSRTKGSRRSRKGG